MWSSWVAPVVGYGLRGTVWFQGEQNTNGTDAPSYSECFNWLITGWRAAWGQGDFPFLFGQLSNIHDAQTDPNNTSNVAAVREGQRMALALPGTAMSMNMDISIANDWHFPNKPVHGHEDCSPLSDEVHGDCMLTRLFAALLLLLLFACSSSDGSAPGTGGSNGTAGTTTSGLGGTGGSFASSGGTLGRGGVGTGGTLASTGGSSPGTGGDNGSADMGGAGPAGSGGDGGAVQGGTTGMGGAAGAGTDDYDPCPPAGEACRVMPLGDSITQGKDGSSDEGGYRETLFRLAHAAGKSIQLVGSRTNGPATVDGVAWPRTHEGYSGYTIPALLKDDLTPNNVKTYKPNIVLLMIGTNDLSVGEDMPEVRLAGIVDTILNADPKLLLFLTQITPGQVDKASYNQKVKPYNAAMVGIVSQRAAAGKHIRLMDMNTPFLSNADYSTALLANGVHPNDAGYKLMGQTWYAVLSPLLH